MRSATAIDHKVRLNVTLPPSLIAEVDAFAQRTAAALGVHVSRASAAEILIRSGLNVRKHAATR